MKKAIINTAAITAISLLMTAPVFAQSQVGITPPSGIPTVGVNEVVRFVIDFLFFIAVLAALIFLIIGGVKWILSGGDKGAVEAARNQIIASVIGLVIVILSYVVLTFVFQLIGLQPLQNLTLPALGNPNVGPFQ